MSKPRTVVETFVVEKVGDEYYVMFPDGTIEVIQGREGVIQRIKRYAKRVATREKAIHVARIEWRLG